MRYIKLADNLKEQLIKDFTNKLEQERFAEGHFNYSFNLNNINALAEEDKVILNIKAEAWLKMWALVNSEKGEIGWHGTVTRHNDKLFEITDIIMYPQQVTGTTVTTDDLEYGNWLHKELSDEQINTLRYHGHSHVNMSTSPSGVDKTWYNDILQGLLNDDYYIFMILNKRNDMFIEIYDLKTNIIYEKADIKINILLNDNNYLDNWVTKEKERAIKTPEIKVTGFQSGRTAQDLDEIKNFVLNISNTDLKDKKFIKEVAIMLQKPAIWTNYFGVGWLDWHELDDEDQIIVAQNYYLGIFDKPKKKTKKGKSIDYNWRKEMFEND